MKLFLKKSIFEDSQEVEGLRERLLEVLNRREDLKRDVMAINAERNRRKYDVEVAEANVQQFSRKFELDVPENVKKTIPYQRGLQNYNALEEAKTSLRQWEEAELPKAPGLEAQIKELEPEIESLKTELESYVVLEVGELQGLVFDSQNKRYRLPE